ncbi:MAG: permease-like cell division protein FtsX [Firmicutes bacterium]|nr:permease-like cell division protein FtsX [Bacillota bacterium]MBR2576847.1 permease-like cell division protein FtsX [Bacillota bacterium]
MGAFSYTVRQAFSQIGRNKNMSSASIFSITAMLLVVGLFFSIMVNVNLMARNAEDQFDTISVYLKETVTAEQGVELAEQIKMIENVSDAKYLSKEDAMAIMKERWGENGYLLDGVVSNPLPASVEVTAVDLEDEDKIVQELNKFEAVDEVRFYRDAIQKVMTISGYIQKGALAIIVILLIVSLIVVANTVKLTVHAREEEIHIMKYVGATNWFVRGPFFVEGILIGLISSILAVVIVGFAYYKFTEMFTPRFLILFNSGMVPFDFIIENLIIIFVALGVCIGALGSILSMRKFLDA